MKKMFLGQLTLASVATAMLIGSVQVAATEGATCNNVAKVPVRGKILNNAQPPAPMNPGFSPLGVARISGSPPVGRLVCGIVGMATGPFSFIHTLSCADSIETPYGPAHSQLTLATSGDFTAPPVYCNGVDDSAGISAPFLETSIPQPGSGRGVFTNAIGGKITLRGSIECTGAIDMQFRGTVDMCLDAPQ